jgi:hypothetical protein
MPAAGSNDALRGFLARLIGWEDARAVELALRSSDLAVNHRVELVLCGAGDMVPSVQPECTSASVACCTR